MQGGVKPGEEHGALSQCNYTVQKKKGKSWTITEGERICVFSSPPKETKKGVSGSPSANAANTLLTEKICHHSFLPPPAQVTGLDTSNTNQYHPVSKFLSLCFSGEAVPETIASLWPHYTAPARGSFRFETPMLP